MCQYVETNIFSLGNILSSTFPTTHLHGELISWAAGFWVDGNPTTLRSSETGGSGSLDHDPENHFLALFIFEMTANLRLSHDECLIKPFCSMTHARRW